MSLAAYRLFSGVPTYASAWMGLAWISVWISNAGFGIPRGKLSTYNLIARHVGKPSAARAVGRALATNPFPIIIPCHRAIRSDRTLGGYQGGLAMKRALLEMEGINLDGRGRVVTSAFFYGGTRRHEGRRPRGLPR
jgi:O-6-methylguanine DNA methyltransferase